jgi:hypothetical protein
MMNEKELQEKEKYIKELCEASNILDYEWEIAKIALEALAEVRRLNEENDLQKSNLKEIMEEIIPEVENTEKENQRLKKELHNSGIQFTELINDLSDEQIKNKRLEKELEDCKKELAFWLENSFKWSQKVKMSENKESIRKRIL